MRYTSVEVGKEYAWNGNGGRHGMDYPGYNAKVKILESVELTGRQAQEEGFHHIRWMHESVKGFRVKLLRKGYIGPQKRGTVFFTQARHLQRTWAEEEERERDATRADRYRKIEAFRELVGMTHLRIRMAGLGLGHYSWDDNRDDDYYIGASAVRLDTDQMHKALSLAWSAGAQEERKYRGEGEDGPHDESALPINARLAVRQARRRNKREKPEYRMFYNGIPVTDAMGQKRVRQILDVLRGRKPLPELPVMEGEDG